MILSILKLNLFLSFLIEELKLFKIEQLIFAKLMYDITKFSKQQ